MTYTPWSYKLSPSDISFKNTLKMNKRIYFIDLEYFGWDDPVKMTSDFLWHPSMSLSNKLKKHWKLKMFTFFNDDQFFIQRFNASYNLYGIRWILIILNDFVPHIFRKRMYNNNLKTKDTKRYLRLQLNKARKICDVIEKELINQDKHVITTKY